MRIYILLFLKQIESVNGTDSSSWKSLDAFRLTEEIKPDLKTARLN